MAVGDIDLHAGRLTAGADGRRTVIEVTRPTSSSPGSPSATAPRPTLPAEPIRTSLWR